MIDFLATLGESPSGEIKTHNMNTNSQEFIRMMTSGIKFRLFLLFKLPSAYFSGVRILSMDDDSCSVTVPYKWFSQNPFKSTYFACLAMAAELSTGALAMAHVHKSRPSVSMLVTSLKASYTKKAVGITCFTCLQGLQFKETIARAITTGEPQLFTATSTGTNKQGEKIAEFSVEWSFKAKK